MGCTCGRHINRCESHESIKGIPQGDIAPGNQAMWREDFKEAYAAASLLHQVIDTPAQPGWLRRLEMEHAIEGPKEGRLVMCDKDTWLDWPTLQQCTLKL